MLRVRYPHRVSSALVKMTLPHGFNETTEERLAAVIVVRFNVTEGCEEKKKEKTRGMCARPLNNDKRADDEGEKAREEFSWDKNSDATISALDASCSKREKVDTRRSRKQMQTNENNTVYLVVDVCLSSLRLNPHALEQTMCDWRRRRNSSN